MNTRIYLMNKLNRGIAPTDSPARTLKSFSNGKNGTRAAIPELERAIQGRNGGEIRLRRAGDTGRGVADLLSTVN